MLNDFLTEHQRILHELLKAEGEMPEKLEKRIREFLVKIDGAIEAHASLTDQLKYTMKKWDIRLEELCAFRNLILNQRSKKHGSNENSGGSE